MPPELGYFPAIEIISDLMVLKFWLKHKGVHHVIKSYQKKVLTKDVNVSYKKQNAARKTRTGTAELPRIRNSIDNHQKETRIRAKKFTDKT